LPALLDAARGRNHLGETPKLAVTVSGVEFQKAVLTVSD